MKIVHIIPNLNKGGAERIVLDICNALKKRADIDVLLISFHEGNEYPFLTKNINWKVIPSKLIPSITGKPIIEVSELQNTINEFNPDIIHSHLFESAIVLSAINFKNATHFVHFHDNMRQFGGFKINGVFNKEMWTDLAERKRIFRAFRNRNLVGIGISEHSLAYVKKVLPESVTCVLLSNAINWEVFSHSTRKKSVNRVVMTGSLVPNKNQLLAIQTIEILKKRNVEVSLDLIGDGILRNELEAYVNQAGLTENVTFHGSLDHPENILKESDIYIHTAKSEAFGLVMIEAMAAGLPCVCTDGGGNRDLILEEGNGFMVKEPRAELLADKIEYLINNPEKRIEMGELAQKFSKQFDISNYVEKLVALYADVLIEINDN